MFPFSDYSVQTFSTSSSSSGGGIFTAATKMLVAIEWVADSTVPGDMSFYIDGGGLDGQKNFYNCIIMRAGQALRINKSNSELNTVNIHKLTLPNDIA